MDPYETELSHSIISVMNEGTLEEDIFEQACLTTVVTCGPPPPKPDFRLGGGYVMQNLGRDGLDRRTRWLAEVEELVTERYNVNPARVGDFIVALEIWWDLTKHDKEKTNEDGHPAS